MSETLEKWMSAYRRAWESNDESDIAALFSDDAVYYNEPFTEPARGRDAVVANWLERADLAGSTTFSWMPVVETDDVAVIQGETGYPDQRYSNLWVIRLDAAGRATEFTEWWMDQAKPS
jgi:ketosteroid isomerase-like protein